MRSYPHQGTAGAASLVSIDQPNVLLVGARRALEGDGLVLRLWELAGKPTTAHVRLPHIPFKKATACNLVEEPLGPLEVREGLITVPIRASGLATVRAE
ncbi:MAG: glycosyl hydrolase-related protein [Thermoguttaceae bacterium]